MQALAQHNQERIKARSKVILPLIFFAMHASGVEGKSVYIHDIDYQYIVNSITY